MAQLINDEIVLMPLLDAMKVEEKHKSKRKQKTQRQRERQWKQNEKKHLRNQELSQLPVFSMDQPYELTFINSKTAFFVLLHLIELARHTTCFTIDMEIDDFSQRPALIQIQFVSSLEKQQEEKVSIIILEMCHLPPMTTQTYQQIQRLVKIIFHPSKKLLVWGNGQQELSKFQIYHLFQSMTLYSLDFIHVQERFKNWYNDTYPHESNCPMAKFQDTTDDPTCICVHRPYKKTNELWALQVAVAHVFEQYLDKSWTRSNWSVGLDIRLYQNLQFGLLSLTKEEDKIRLELIKYAMDDCFATTKLALIIGSYLVRLF
jgi:hypothetical protein